MKSGIGIIPARYNSSRFEGKPLAEILGKPMIQRVYEAAKTAKFLERVIIATDNDRIFKTAEAFGAEVRMTSSLHQTGTDRVAEVARNIDTSIVINIQGDEPLIRGEMIDELIAVLQDDNIPMATLASKVEDSTFVYRDEHGFAMDFLKTPKHFFEHIGIYGYQKEFLLKLCEFPQSNLEKETGLEQHRVLANGYSIKVIETPYKTKSVNIPSDIKRVEDILRQQMRIQ